jgi:hypothetical protein
MTEQYTNVADYRTGPKAMEAADKFTRVAGPESDLLYLELKAEGDSSLGSSIF